MDVLQSIPSVFDGVKCGDTELVARALEDISQSIQDMTDALKMMQGSHTDALMNVQVYCMSSC